ncbi:flagellar biosynthesis protein FlhA [Polynucleobacter sp. AP-Kaivos-20-H2]|uniref:flagellar biosynthesis protein FlhA n=1 Tax=Polynucleobacter sp. AP-Kaivos-20-H2 TaxID=2689104 RepID=UPI001C0E17B6|nr:flagellar biosynthesis protein FlhA [Polynucleobacter sp. AP-Kaivos-20-H2]MBU3603361.1 flagellar biosynthesis protein FlhA [Polynucleobacter sp. AP-Kaivos-20-H2]
MNLTQFLDSIKNLNSKTVAGPAIIVLLLAMMILPIPAIGLDLLFTFNIALSILVLMIGLQTSKPLDFLAFPTVLLVTTMLRLSLNVASTRLVLTEGHTGPAAAGKVIEAFGHFLIGGNYAVGIVVFIILTIINFTVVTKGAGRIAEVGARFTLDAMPGKQMAIDADLNAGLIGQDEARSRRSEISQEAEFYGAMDGASKYVRGDAIAGILVIVINILGGLIVGMLQHDLSFSDAVKNYTLLAIGDGLVAQIPSLIISVAAGIVVSRVANNQDIGTQLTKQLFTNPKVLNITAMIIGGMGLIPGMPNLAFLLLAMTLAGIAYSLKSQSKKLLESESQAKKEEAQESVDATWDDVRPVDALSLEIGFRLVPLVDLRHGGDLIKRIKALRKKFAQDIGFLTPSIHISDNLELKPSEYSIKLKGVEIAKGESHYGQYLAINPGNAIGQLPGPDTTDPAFGLEATWIENDWREQAQSMGYTVVDASTVIATHLNHIIGMHASELLGHQEVQQLVTLLGKESPKLVEDLIPKLLTVSVVQKVLQNLLAEGVTIRDMRTIMETLIEYAPHTQDPAELTAKVRIKLGRAITHQLFPDSDEMSVISLENNLERLLMQAVSGSGDNSSIEPGIAKTLANEANEAAKEQERNGHSPVLLVASPLRATLAKFLKRVTPNLRVLSHEELPDSKTIRVANLIGGSV